jgi:hypothetical protein
MIQDGARRPGIPYHVDRLGFQMEKAGYTRYGRGHDMFDEGFFSEKNLDTHGRSRKACSCLPCGRLVMSVLNVVVLRGYLGWLRRAWRDRSEPELAADERSTFLVAERMA